MASRIALVTGANSGIGFAVCRQLAGAGMQVFLGSRDLSEGEHAARQTFSPRVLRQGSYAKI